MKKKTIRNWLKAVYKVPFDQSVDAFKDLIDKLDKDDDSSRSS